jgi:hypothetical protein
MITTDMYLNIVHTCTITFVMSINELTFEYSFISDHSEAAIQAIEQVDSRMLSSPLIRWRVNIFICRCIFIHICRYIHIYMYTYMCMFMYIYIYVYIYIYIYIYI